MIQRIFCISILILLSCSCHHEEELGFEFMATDIIYYPDKHISMTFDIIPVGNKGPCVLKWYDPDSLSENGPFTIGFTKDLLLDFEIQDGDVLSDRFTYEIKIDTIDSLKYDYRNDYAGIYFCNVEYSYQDSVRYYTDTLTVRKNISFNDVNILTRHDLEKNYDGNRMTYLNTNGFYNSPTGSFYGYHSYALFSNDSIYYTASGPLGFYYTNYYEGIRISQE